MTVKLYQNVKWPCNFEIVHTSLFDILKKFTAHVNVINNDQLGYKIIYSKSTLYLQSKETNIFYVYIYNNKSYILLAFIKFQSDLIFQGILNQYLKEKSFIQYLLEKKIDINNLNQKMQIKSSRNEEIANLTIIYQINQNAEINTQTNLIVEGNTLINDFQFNIPNQNNIVNPNDNNLNIEEKKNDIIKINYSIFKNYQKFYEKLKFLKKKDNFGLSSAIKINEYLSLNQSSYLPVYLMNKTTFNYYIIKRKLFLYFLFLLKY
jgi:hypothetical protein